MQYKYHTMQSVCVCVWTYLCHQLIVDQFGYGVTQVLHDNLCVGSQTQLQIHQCFITQNFQHDFILQDTMCGSSTGCAEVTTVPSFGLNHRQNAKVRDGSSIPQYQHILKLKRASKCMAEHTDKT